jgi:hypothetical protein
MTIPTNPIEPFSPFLPTTYNVPEADDRLDVFLVDNLSTMSDVINDKKIGNYTELTAGQNGEKWIYKTTQKVRDGSQAIAYIPSLPNNTTLTLTGSQYPIKNINNQFVITKLFGTASKPPTSVSAGNGNFFMYNCEGDSRISFTFSDTTIVITTTTDLSAYSGFIVCEFVRNGY